MIKLFGASVALLAIAAALSTGPAAAQSDDRMSRSIAAAKTAIDRAAANYGAVPAARAAQEQADSCYGRHLSKARPADLSVTDLMALQACVGELLTRLHDRMLGLKSLQHAARFDYALFSETARVLTTSSEPSLTVISPFVAMLEAAQAASQDASQQTLLAELNQLGDGLQTRLVQ